MRIQTPLPFLQTIFIEFRLQSNKKTKLWKMYPNKKIKVHDLLLNWRIRPLAVKVGFVGPIMGLGQWVLGCINYTQLWRVLAFELHLVSPRSKIHHTKFCFCCWSPIFVLFAWLEKYTWSFPPTISRLEALLLLMIQFWLDVRFQM